MLKTSKRSCLLAVKHFS